MKRTKELPDLVVADEKGNIFNIPQYKMTVSSAGCFLLPEFEDIISLPAGSDIFFLPEHSPVGYDEKNKKFFELSEWNNKKVNAVASFLAPAYMQYFLSAFKKRKDAPTLPFYAYTAIGWYKGRFVVTGTRTDKDPRQDPLKIDLKKVERLTRDILNSKLKKNRLVVHLLKNCVLLYGCPAARNFVLGRYECPLPTSNTCNANCIACISEQPCDSCVTAPQDRIEFVPSPEEIAEVALFHINRVKDPVVSFGQGCEGEPLLVYETIKDAISIIRKNTEKGVINLNTNASMPERLEKLFMKGLDSIRISINSFRKNMYNAYFRQKTYSFEDVLESAKITKKFSKWLSVNYFIFPGFTDTEDEFKSLRYFIKKFSPDMIQTRNLNIDPDLYIKSLKISSMPGFGLRNWLDKIKKESPSLAIGYFNPGKKFMRRYNHGI